MQASLRKKPWATYARTALALWILHSCQSFATHHRSIDHERPTTLLRLLAIDPDIPIIFENDHCLAIHKPAGIAHHSTMHESGILATIRQAQEEGSFPYLGRIYGVHRLDRVTSGILLLAKDAEAASELTVAFRKNLVVKYYTGLSRHKATQKKKKQGWVQGSMVRGRRKSWYLTRTTSKKEDSVNFAKTRFYTAGLGGLSETARENNKKNLPKTLILLRPHTGRTHQLRVAAKSVGLPLAGDPIYRDGYDDDCNRTYLHATGLHIPAHAMTNLPEISIWCSPPFEHWWDERGRKQFHESLHRLLEKDGACTELLTLFSKIDIPKPARDDK